MLYHEDGSKVWSFEVETSPLLPSETGHKQALQQDNESLRRQCDSLSKMKGDLQDEKDALEQKYNMLLVRLFDLHY